MKSKFWYVAQHEYRKHVFRKKFLLAIFSVPLLLGVSFLAGFVSEALQLRNEPIGYVDQAGVLADPVEVPEEIASIDPVEIIAFPDKESASRALEAEEIQAYYLFPDTYLLDREVTLVYIDDPGNNAKRDFRDFMQANLSTKLPAETRMRVLEGFAPTIRAMDGSREFNETRIFNLILPIVFGFMFTFVLTSGSGYLSNAVTEEKENRTIEMLSTTMSANQFIIGKVIGIVLVIFTQVVSWILFFLAAFYGARAAFDSDWIDAAVVEPGLLFQLVIIFIPAFFFFAGIALTISSTVTESAEGQQALAIISMPVGFSYWFAYVIISNPNSPLSIGLSLFPFTAPTLMPLRIAFGSVPMSQVLLLVAINTVGAIFTIWLAARAYEIGMMQYGKRIRLRELLRKPANGK